MRDEPRLEAEALVAIDDQPRHRSRTDPTTRRTDPLDVRPRRRPPRRPSVGRCRRRRPCSPATANARSDPAVTLDRVVRDADPVRRDACHPDDERSAAALSPTNCRWRSTTRPSPPRPTRPRPSPTSTPCARPCCAPSRTTCELHWRRSRRWCRAFATRRWPGPHDQIAEALVTVDEETDRLNAARREPARRQPAADRHAGDRRAADPGCRRGRRRAAQRERADRTRPSSTFPATSPPVRCDGALLERSLANIIANAERFSPLDVPVRIEAAPIGDDVHIRIVDRGIGITAWRPRPGRPTVPATR